MTRPTLCSLFQDCLQRGWSDSEPCTEKLSHTGRRGWMRLDSGGQMICSQRRLVLEQEEGTVGGAGSSGW